MRLLKVIACLVLLVAPTVVQADEKTRAQGQIDAAKAAIDAFAKKTYDNKLVAADIEAARSVIKKGEEAMITGRQMFGLGDISPEAGRDVKHYADMVDLHLTLGQLRLDKTKAAEELKPIKNQVDKIKARVRIFEDRKTELEKLRASLVKYETVAKELENLKAENARLAEKEGKLMAEQKALGSELGQLKAELAKRDAAVPAAPVVPAIPETAPTAK